MQSITNERSDTTGQPEVAAPFVLPAIPRLTKRLNGLWPVIGLCLLLFPLGCIVGSLTTKSNKGTSAITVTATTRPMTVAEKQAIAEALQPVPVIVREDRWEAQVKLERKEREEQLKQEEQKERLNRIIHRKAPAIQPLWETADRPQPVDMAEREERLRDIEALEARLDKLEGK